MITARKVELTSGDNYYEFSGLSSDEKPTDDVGENSLFLELNTKKFYYYTSNDGWLEYGTEPLS